MSIICITGPEEKLTLFHFAETRAAEGVCRSTALLVDYQLTQNLTAMSRDSRTASSRWRNCSRK